MAVAKGRPGHLTVLRASLLLLLLLVFSSRASARDSLHEASSRGKGGAKYAQKAAATAASSSNNRQRAARAGKQQQQRQHPAQLQQEQRAGPSLLDRDGSAAGTSKKDAQLQQRAGHGGEKSSRKKGSQQQGGGLQAEEDFPGQGSRGAAREPGKQPKALHAEQFPGNGAQGDHEKPEKRLQAASVQAQQPRGLEEAAKLPEKLRQAASFEVIGGQSSQDGDQLSATLKRLEGLRGASEAAERDLSAAEKLNGMRIEPAAAAKGRGKPWQGLWDHLKKKRERAARKAERQQRLKLRAKAKGDRAARRASRQRLQAAKEEEQYNRALARHKAAQLAEATEGEKQEGQREKAMYQRGMAMLEAARAMQEVLQTPELTQQFRRFRAEGRAGNGTFRRGILISTGGTTLINHAYATVSVIRKTLNCTLPVEIVYNGEYEMDSKTCHRFEADFQDVRCIDASKLDWYPPHHRPVSLRKEEADAKGSKADTEGAKDTSGFQFKVFTLCYLTSFDEVLMLDSDNLPLRNPEDLFEAAEYRRSGTLFFSDWWDLAEWVKPQAYTAFGLPYPGQERALLAAESGQLLLNRNMHADALEWLWFVNSHAEVVYRLMYGDKDTFRLAFALAGKSDYFEQVSLPPSCPLDASEDNAEPVKYLHAGMIQHDPSGNPAFLHRTAEGKVYPFNHGYRKAHYLTVPLSARRAAGVLGHDFKKMGLRSSQIDHATYTNCSHPDPQTFHVACGVSLKSGAYPVPVIPVADIANLAPVLEASYAVHDQLQHAFHTTFVMG
ncbi:hypothetical protein CVIRNUC_009390 [Coccomyxa viridis]|uniref:Uncharacterized protein n=1 Tax=Coccomyxa viridis TaxID=1274662 RepID=A0AAV1IIZ2_9CHLO|nr:hypothetical protein CVIRNUC_009390 [Coccomyxa viridis]